MQFSYDDRSITYADGARAGVYVTRFPASSLHFATITQTGARARMVDASHLRHYQALARGESVSGIVAWACLEHDVPVGELFPDVDAISKAGEHILSANSWITYVLRRLFSRAELQWRSGSWEVVAGDIDPDWRRAAQQVVSWLEHEQRLSLTVAPGQPRPTSLAFDEFNPMRDLLPIGRCGFVRDYAATERPRAAFNTSFFLLEHDDFLSHHSAVGEPHGLGVTAGTILRPPLYRRAAMWHMPAHGWQTGSIGMDDIMLVLPDGTPVSARSSAGLRCHLNAADEQAIVLYTRCWGVAQQGRVWGHTPERPGRLEITIVDSRIVGWQHGGGLLIPQNGFVLSFGASALSRDQIQAVQRFGHVRYAFVRDDHRQIDRAIQCGPQLVRDGKVVIQPRSLDDEEFWVSRVVDGQRVIGIVPTDFPDDVDRTRAGRIGLGIDPNGDVLTAAIPGISKGLEQTAGDSAGATLKELAECMVAEGALEAINLDGGGSTQLFVDGGLFARQGDRRGYDGVVFDRLVPVVGVAQSP